MLTKLNNKTLFLVSIIEGGVLMAYEIMSSKLYAPLIGSSIYVWTSILSITLLGLALGYQKGDKIQEKFLVKELIKSLLISGIYISIIVHLLTYLIMPIIDADIRIISLITGGLLLFIPMYYLGHVSPILVRLLNNNSSDQQVGFSSGVIYFLGTLSGIIFAMMAVFVFMEMFGVTMVVFTLGIVLILLALTIKFKTNKS